MKVSKPAKPSKPVQRSKKRPVMLITGGSRGIGAATALLAATQGYDLVISYAQQATAAKRLQARLEKLGAKCLCVQADVGDEAQVLSMFKVLDSGFGRLDVLVNNAGIVGEKSEFAAMSMARWRRMFDVNVLGSFLCAREAIKRMKKGASIVNVSSAAARLGSPFEYIDYAASKGAIDSMTLGLGKELAGRGIRVNAVRPGLIETDIHASGGQPDRVERMKGLIPMQRGGTAQEIAATILWLASSEASYVTCALVDASGGR